MLVGESGYNQIMSTSFYLAKQILVALFVVALIDGCAARCMRHAKGVSRNSKKSGDGGYRIYIDGQPERYQPGKVYNGKLFLQFDVHHLNVSNMNGCVCKKFS